MFFQKKCTISGHFTKEDIFMLKAVFLGVFLDKIVVVKSSEYEYEWNEYECDHKPVELNQVNV